MSKEIDWSKAPEGATHYTNATDDYYAAFWRNDNGKAVELWVVHPSGDIRHVKDPYPSTSEIDRMIEIPKSWAGTGLPPVGTVCETERNEFFRRVEILYIGVERVFVRDENGEEIALLLDGRQFFPVRTKEQIEADEREKAVQEMQDIVNSTPVAYRVGLYALYDAGYRKTEAGK